MINKKYEIPFNTPKYPLKRHSQVSLNLYQHPDISLYYGFVVRLKDVIKGFYEFMGMFKYLYEYKDKGSYSLFLYVVIQYIF